MSAGWVVYGLVTGTLLALFGVAIEGLVRQHRLPTRWVWAACIGAAAALAAAALRKDVVGAVVSRGGRPDLAGAALMLVQAPTLLIVGENDGQVIQLNREALAQLRCEKQLMIVPGATHLFEEPGALDVVARLASDWFERHLVPAA